MEKQPQRLIAPRTQSRAWSVPIMSTHDAIIQARLDDLQGRLGVRAEPETSPPAATVAARSEGDRPSLRARLGRRLIAFGATLAGEDECPNVGHVA